MIAVSVVMPTYNRAGMLGDAIQSILAQTFQDWELVIVDDGSTDNTRDLVATYADPRIRYIVREHRGVSATLNHGWRAATGEWIGRLDSDDRWHPEFLRTLLSVVSTNPALILAYARAQWMDASGDLLAPILGAPEKFPGQSLKSLLYGDFIAPMAVILRRSRLETVGGYDESLIANEDWDLWIRLAELGPFAFVDRVLAYYRVHSSNLSGNKASQNLRLISDRKRVLTKYYAQPHLAPEALEIKPLAFRNLYEDIGIRHLHAHRWRQALASLRDALVVSPNRIEALVRIARNITFSFLVGRTQIGISLQNAWARRKSNQNSK